MKDNRLRTLWQQDRPAVNAWLSLRDGFAAELMAHQGFDALTVDLQHGLADTHTLLPMLQAIAATPRCPWCACPGWRPAC